MVTSILAMTVLLMADGIDTRITVAFGPPPVIQVSIGRRWSRELHEAEDVSLIDTRCLTPAEARSLVHLLKEVDAPKLRDPPRSRIITTNGGRARCRFKATHGWSGFEMESYNRAVPHRLILDRVLKLGKLQVLETRFLENLDRTSQEALRRQAGGTGLDGSRGSVTSTSPPPRAR